MSKFTTHLLPGTSLYKYILRYRVGVGRFGEVWLAEDKALGCEYAIKILKTGIPIHQRLREARIGHALDHENLVRVHHADVVQERGSDFVIVAMDYMANGSITKMVNSSSFLILPEVIRLGCDILRGLDYLHEQDLFHNDVKPENILIGPQKRGMLTDYGIVGVSQNGAPIPPPKTYTIHAAPEVIENNSISPQTDIFQVGLTLFRLLVGLGVLRSKFKTMGEQDYYDAIVNAKLVTVSDFPSYVPSNLRRIVLKALHPDLSRRYTSALEMRRALEKLNYSAYWEIKPTGEFVGVEGDYEYRYEKIEKGENKYDVKTYRRKLSTGRETRVPKFCLNGVKNSIAEKQVNRFIKAVVEKI